MKRSNDKLHAGEPSEPDKPDDIELASFLKTNAPSVSEPGPGFEDQLMQALSKDVPNRLPRQHPLRSRFKYRWNSTVAAFVGLGIGAIAIGLGQLHERFAPSGISSVELAQIEPFMVDDWDETMRPSETTPRGWDGLGIGIQSPPAMSASDSVQNSNPPLSDHSES